MNPVQMRQQLEIIRITMRREPRRLSPVDMAPVRRRAYQILDQLDAAAGGDDELREEIAALRREIS